MSEPREFTGDPWIDAYLTFRRAWLDGATESEQVKQQAAESGLVEYYARSIRLCMPALACGGPQRQPCGPTWIGRRALPAATSAEHRQAYSHRVRPPTGRNSP
jgi:hypothetical protein